MLFCVSLQVMYHIYMNSGCECSQLYKNKQTANHNKSLHSCKIVSTVALCILFIQVLATLYWHVFLATAKNIYPHLGKKQRKKLHFTMVHTLTIKSAACLSVNRQSAPASTVGFWPSWQMAGGENIISTKA